MVKVNCKTHGSDVERRDIWVDDWNKSNVDAVKASDFDALLTERDALRAVYEAASGLCMGMDWNHGTHAGKYKVELIHAVKVAEAALAARGKDE
jgi:hypothetical protein